MLTSVSIKISTGLKEIKNNINLTDDDNSTKNNKKYLLYTTDNIDIVEEDNIAKQDSKVISVAEIVEDSKNVIKLKAIARDDWMHIAMPIMNIIATKCDDATIKYLASLHLHLAEFPEKYKNISEIAERVDKIKNGKNKDNNKKGHKSPWGSWGVQ